MLDVDAELSANEDKTSDAEILAEIRRGVVQEEETDDINVFYDKTPEPALALELKFFNSSRICEEGQ